MKKIFHQILISLSLIVFGFYLTASPAFAAKLLMNPSSGTVTGATAIEVKVDPEGTALDSVSAVITYDSSKVEISQITNGGLFPNMGHNLSVNNEITISGTTSVGDLSGISSQGVLAVMTVTPKASSGTFSLTFSCSPTSATDSSIQSMDNVNLIATAEQCSSNVSGTYTIGTATDDDDDSSSDNDSASDDDSSSTTDTNQPVEPDTLPEAGVADWLKVLTSGLALLGIGLLLL